MQYRLDNLYDKIEEFMDVIENVKERIDRASSS